MIRCDALPSCLSFISIRFNQFSYVCARMQDLISYMTLSFRLICDVAVKRVFSPLVNATLLSTSLHYGTYRIHGICIFIH